MVKILSDFEIMLKLMDSYVCLETGWADLLRNVQSLRNSIRFKQITINIWMAVNGKNTNKQHTFQPGVGSFSWPVNAPACYAYSMESFVQ